eukprot:8556530-Alexandrium_andersonii.AAC.1
MHSSPTVLHSFVHGSGLLFAGEGGIDRWLHPLEMLEAMAFPVFPESVASASGATSLFAPGEGFGAPPN